MIYQAILKLLKSTKRSRRGSKYNHHQLGDEHKVKHYRKLTSSTDHSFEVLSSRQCTADINVPKLLTEE